MVKSAWRAALWFGLDRIGPPLPQRGIERLVRCTLDGDHDGSRVASRFDEQIVVARAATLIVEECLLLHDHLVEHKTTQFRAEGEESHHSICGTGFGPVACKL